MAHALRRPARWATNSLRWFWRCCRPAATRRRSTPTSSNRSAASKGDFDFETYISLSCHNCPDVVQALNLMAVLNPRIRHVMIDGALFQDEVDARKVMAVPTVYPQRRGLRPGPHGARAKSWPSSTPARPRATPPSSSHKAPFDVLVVGGGPAGAAAAIYAARKGIRTGIVAERFGGQVLDTMAIENFISVPETEGPKLAARAGRTCPQYDVDIMNLQRAVKLDARQRRRLHEVRLANGAALKAKTRDPRHRRALARA